MSTSLPGRPVGAVVTSVRAAVWSRVAPGPVRRRFACFVVFPVSRSWPRRSPIDALTLAPNRL